MAFLISIPEASKSLGISKAHLYRLIKAGRIPFYRLSPRTTRLDVEEIKSLGRLIGERKPEEGQR